MRIYVLIIGIFSFIHFSHGDAYLYEASTYNLHSSSDETGIFNYSFTETTNGPSRIYDVQIRLNTEFVDSVISPSGWESSITPSDITWSRINTTEDPPVLSDIPLVFSISSSQTNTILNSDGISTIGAQIQLPGGGSSWAGGYEKFTYLQPIPEPSTISLIAIAGVAFVILKRNMRFRTSAWTLRGKTHNFHA